MPDEELEHMITVYKALKLSLCLYVPWKFCRPNIEPGGKRLRSWLRHSATSRKVAGSSPDGVDFFNLPWGRLSL
jgi:hypothetical protein